MAEQLVGAPGAISLIDCETLCLAGQVVQVRGIAFPACEAGGLYGARTLPALSALSTIVWDRRVQCVPHSRDEQGRAIVDCDANGTDLAEATLARLAVRYECGSTSSIHAGRFARFRSTRIWSNRTWSTSTGPLGNSAGFGYAARAKVASFAAWPLF